MKRRLFDAAAMLSLLLAAAILALTLISYWQALGVAWRRTLRLDGVAISRGHICFGTDIATSNISTGQGPLGWSGLERWDPFDYPPMIRSTGAAVFGGFALSDQTKAWGQAKLRSFVVLMPGWFVILMLGVLPVLRWRSWRRNRIRSQRGKCARCGYDLRATPDRCPECGTVATPTR